MSIALVITHKTMGGHRWSNTHCVQIGAEDSQAPTATDLQTIGAAGTFTDAQTNGSPTNILQAILAFERTLTPTVATFTDILVTDGKRNTGANPSTMYATASINLPGLVTAQQTWGAGVDILEPGAVTCLVHRNVAGFSHKPGRLFLRGVLAESDVTVGGPRMVQWSGGAPSAGWVSAFNAAAAKLAPYFLGGANATTMSYVLPVYVTPKQKFLNPNLPPVGSLVLAIGCSGLSLVGPVVRQVQRGRKRHK